MYWKIIADIQKELESNIDPAPKVSPSYYFKEEVKFHGVKTAVVGQIGRRRFQEIKDRKKEDIFALCTALLATDYSEEAFIACEWSYRLRDRFEPADIELFEDWLKKYINNWAKCDTLCNHTMGAFIEKYPQFTERLKEWAKSENRWLRRAAAVTLILPARKGKFLKEVFEIADILLTDKDDLVQKGYGWMLREAAKMHQADVFDYILKNKGVMPRTALRYAIEKFPDHLKKAAMARDNLAPRKTF
jgi:3-methyladenine DNA glycosylase AlkD